MLKVMVCIKVTTEQRDNLRVPDFLFDCAVLFVLYRQSIDDI